MPCPKAHSILNTNVKEDSDYHKPASKELPELEGKSLCTLSSRVSVVKLGHFTTWIIWPPNPSQTNSSCTPSRCSSWFLWEENLEVEEIATVYKVLVMQIWGQKCNSQHPYRKLGIVAYTYNVDTDEADKGRSQSPWTASLAKWWLLGLRGEILSQNSRWMVPEEGRLKLSSDSTCRCTALHTHVCSSHTGMHTWKHAHTQVHKQTHTHTNVHFLKRLN